jgi:hypothetical protein
MGVDVPESADTRFGGGAGRPVSPVGLTAALGSTGVLVAASVLGMVLAFAEKSPCRAGAWNSYASQFQRACYTDIYPLYYGEGLSAGKVPYTGHPVEYPVLIGGAMQAAAWLVRNVSEAVRGREFFDVTVALLAVCAVAGVLATARAAGPKRSERRAQALMVALSPALILSAFVNWDLIALAFTALGSPPGRPAVASGPASCSASPSRRSSIPWWSSDRCCCCACGPAGCASSRGRWPPRRPRGWSSTCRC